ncbi:hypothetical protein PHET_07519 [Paragonimus heterotremus]|uniref:Uncharacterized protein n=1 Tax=Paragonimus heterotremus TaxID=100268 RepID=A0A8J4WGJ1_9TREM|nr:hypothetical protein PHET_07519 [Paragonimus heterotremus]
MAYQFRRDSKPSTDSIGLQRPSSDYTESQIVPNTRDSLPKYYPRDHEVTRWLVNQMRCRNGLHHLVNLANVQPNLLSAYFELFDQPHLYIDARTGPGMPAYSIKTVLYLTPLAIAIYFRLRSVLRLLLDTSGTRIHARARQEIDVNATCYVRRTKPRPGPFVMDEYSTTHPAIIAVRREFFAGLNLLMTANFHPQAPIGIVERLGTTRETIHWFVDLLDFCVKLLNTRPGVDVIGLLQTISFRTISDTSGSAACYYDPCVYDVRPVMSESGSATSNDEIWCSVFHRLARKGASRSYSNCGNRLIGLLEHVMAAGFFRKKYMPKGPVNYSADLVNRKAERIGNTQKMSPEMIDRLSGPQKEAARLNIAVDRDACLCLLTLWLERVRNRCLDRQAQRLFRLLTTSLAETGLLHDFLFPPCEFDANTMIHPYWLSVGLSRMSSRQTLTVQPTIPVDFLEDDANEICELEAPQVNEIRQEIGILGHAMGLVDYSEKLYNLGYPRLVEIMPLSGAVGDAENFTPDSNGSAPQKDCFKDNIAPQDEIDSEDFERKQSHSRASCGGNLMPTGVPRRPGVSNVREFWPSPNRNLSMSPPIVSSRIVNTQVVKIQDSNNDNKNNDVRNGTPGDTKVEEEESNSPEIIVEQTPEPAGSKEDTRKVTKPKKCVLKKDVLSRSKDRTLKSKQTNTRGGVWRNKRADKTKTA